MSGTAPFVCGSTRIARLCVALRNTRCNACPPSGSRAWEYRDRRRADGQTRRFGPGTHATAALGRTRFGRFRRVSRRNHTFNLTLRPISRGSR